MTNGVGMIPDTARRQPPWLTRPSDPGPAGPWTPATRGGQPVLLRSCQSRPLPRRAVAQRYWEAWRQLGPAGKPASQGAGSPRRGADSENIAAAGNGDQPWLHGSKITSTSNILGHSSRNLRRSTP